MASTPTQVAWLLSWGDAVGRLFALGAQGIQRQKSTPYAMMIAA